MGFHPLKWFAGFVKRRNILFVSLAWFFGILIGSLFAVSGGDTYYVLLQNASCQPVTLPGLIGNTILPVSILFIAIKLSSLWLLMLTVFAKVTFVTTCSVGLYFVYGAADWLVRIFVQFSDILTLPVLCWLSLNAAAKPISKATVSAVAVWYILVCLTDYYVISPFFAGLIVN